MSWANGKTVQYKFDGPWRDFSNDSHYSFNDEDIQWRIKPTNNIFKYRVALMKYVDCDYYTNTISSSKNSCYSIEEQHDMTENDPNFVCWMDDYQDYYIS
jgi:hypothetical protein